MEMMANTGKYVFILIGVLINLIVILVNCSIWVRLSPPASALFTLPKLMYPNIVDKAIYGYFGMAVIIMALLLMAQFKLFGIPGYIKIVLVITLVVLSVVAISSDMYINKLNHAQIEYTNSEVVGKAVETVEYDITNRVAIDLRENLTNEEVKPSVFMLYQPAPKQHKTDVVMYLAYGNWVGVDPSIADYFVDALNKKGYMAAVFTGQTRKETDFIGIVKDIKKYVAYLRNNSEELGIGKIFLSGGSAGANLALTAAYGNSEKEFQVEGLTENETKVDGVIAFYPVVDMVYNYDFFTNKDEGRKNIADKMGDKLFSISDVNKAKSIEESHKKVMKFLLGGFPQEEGMEYIYNLSSPTFLVKKESPPTILIHGAHDSMTPIEPTRVMFNKLKNVGVNAAMLELPFTDHAFDAVLPEDSIVTKKVLDSVFEWLSHF